MSIEATRAAKYNYTSKQELTFRSRPTETNDKNNARSDRFERASERNDRLYEKFQAREARRKNKKNEEVSIPTPPPVTPQPPTPPTNTTPPVVEVSPTKPVDPTPSSGTYAERYVAIYEKNSGISLSAEERTAKVNAVTEFYSDPSRANRLETLVNSLVA